MTLLEKRRQGTILRTMTADPLRKLAALALALGLWYYLDDQRSDEQTQSLRLGTSSTQAAPTERNRLFARLASDEYIATFYNANDSTKIDAVDVTLRGPKERVENATAAGVLLTVDMTKVDWSTTSSREFSASDTRLDRAGFADVELSLTPPRVRVEVERYDRRPIQIGIDRVNVAYENDDLRSRVQIRTAKFTPSQPRIGGPASLVKKLIEDISNGTNPKPFLARFQGSTNDLRMTVGVALEVPELKLLDQVNLEVEVEPQLYPFTLNVPVLPNYASLPAGVRYAPQLDGDSMTVKLLAGGALYNLLSPQDDSMQAEWARKNLALIPQLQLNEGTPPDELSAQALLIPIGLQHERINPKECRLAEPVVITFKLVP